MSDELVSILIPVYNGEDLIEHTLTMLTGQTHKNIEITVSDDASTDRTGEICRRVAHADPRVKYRRNSQRLGLWGNWLEVAKSARGKYVMWAAHDDIYDPNFVSILVAELENHPEAVLAFCATTVVDYDGNIVVQKKVNLPASFNSLGELGKFRTWFTAGHPTMQGPSAGMYRGDVAQGAVQEAQFRGRALFGLDGLIPIYCLKKGDIRFRPDHLFFYRLKKETARVADALPPPRPTANRLKRFLNVAKSSPAHLARYFVYWRRYRDGIPVHKFPWRERWRLEVRLVSGLAVKPINDFRRWLGVPTK